jgi:tetratricopeptide (TPR) repeat protein
MMQREQLGEATAGVSGASSDEALRRAATTAGLVVALIFAVLAGWRWAIAEGQKVLLEVQVEEAQAQRDRAEHGLSLATQTANGLILDLARKLRNPGLMAGTARDILGRARTLQEQLQAGGWRTPDLWRGEAAALDEIADTLLALGDTDGAVAAATQARDVFASLVASAPDSTDYRRELSGGDVKVGDVLKAQGRLDDALAAYRASLAVREALALKDPSDTQLQRDIAVSNARIGDALKAQARPDRPRRLSRQPRRL